MSSPHSMNIKRASKCLGAKFFGSFCCCFYLGTFCFYLFSCLLSLAACCLELGVPCAFRPYYFHLLLCTFGVLLCYFTLLFPLVYCFMIWFCWIVISSPSPLQKHLCKSWNGKLHIFLCKLGKIFTFHLFFLKTFLLVKFSHFVYMFCLLSLHC